jgi:hypothetical protein
MKASNTATADPHTVMKYKDRANNEVELLWREADLKAVVEGQPWRRFPWYLGQRNYSGSYWSATERGMVGYESRLELAHLVLADFDTNVQRIASQPFHLVIRADDRRVRRTPDYLLMTATGARIVDVKPWKELPKEEVKQLACAGQYSGAGRGLKVRNNRPAMSIDLVDNGVRRSAVMQRLYQSIDTVSSTRTHRNVTGSSAKTSSRLESITRYSPGRVGRSFPYSRLGRSATSRLRCLLP